MHLFDLNCDHDYYFELLVREERDAPGGVLIVFYTAVAAQFTAVDGVIIAASMSS
jgi:hypothetical protein